MLKDQIKAAVMTAMKEKRNTEKEVLRVALGEIQTEESRRGEDLDDASAEKILRKLIKSNEESIRVARDDETKARLALENVTLQALVPQQLTVDEILAQLKGQVDAIKSASGSGPAMGIAMKTLKASGASVNGKSVGQAIQRIRT